MTLDPQLLDLICCPVTRQPVAPLPRDTIAKLNRLIRERRLKSRDDSIVSTELTEALVTQDGKIAYPIVDGFPVMIEEHGIRLSQLDAG